MKWLKKLWYELFFPTTIRELRLCDVWRAARANTEAVMSDTDDGKPKVKRFTLARFLKDAARWMPNVVRCELDKHDGRQVVKVEMHDGKSCKDDGPPLVLPSDSLSSRTST